MSEDLSNKIERKTVIVLANASIHQAKIVQNKMIKWRTKCLSLQFIPTY